MLMANTAFVQAVKKTYLAGHMQLTVIIVNYNVKHFLEQCLYALRDAVQSIEAETIVVDNNSTDGSIEYLQTAFPNVLFIKNQKNVGFAKANNQAAALAKGRYILFLNPDTLVAPSAITKSISFIESKPGAGALGICMLDGSGKFLPESKRAFPSPLTSLFKLSGLSSLFPRSKLFARYHLGNLPAGKTHVVDVLAGAYMLVKKEVINKIGCFDETFFMYGEDIDLSFRIQQAGWNNYYFAGSSIIHFKGESTKKGSLNYVRMFYQAMMLFVEKHYSSGRAGIFKLLIRLAIWARALISALGRFIKWIGLPVLDALLVASCTAAVGTFWQAYIRPGTVFPPKVLLTIMPVFILVFILAGAVAGLYNSWYKPARAWFAMMLGVVCNLAIYSLFDIDYRFSRGVILFGGLFASLSIIVFRFLLSKTGLIMNRYEKKEHRQTLICGSKNSYGRVQRLMASAGRSERIMGRISPLENEADAIGSFQQLHWLLHNIPAREIIFCMDAAFTLSDAINFMQSEKRNIRYTFYYAGSKSIVGSESKETSGETVSLKEKFAIDDAEKKHVKRTIDVITAIILLPLMPVNIFLVKKPFSLLRNIWQVISLRKTWVGYSTKNNDLPAIPEPVLANNGLPANSQQNMQSPEKLDYWYAKDYDGYLDIKTIVKGYRYLGN
jgi:GT2 family glycosyltransferase